MEETRYYSVMKKDELAIPWTNDAQKVLNLLKTDEDALLLSMSGKEDEKTKKWVDHGMIETYEQQTLDELIGDFDAGGFYLDDTFAIIDYLDQKGNLNGAPYVSALYLVAGMTKLMQMPEKLTWLIGIATAYAVGVDHQIDIHALEIAGWNKEDTKFVDKLSQTPYEAPKWSKNPVTIQFSPIGNMYYFQAAKVFQDIMELLKLNRGQFDFENIQNKESYELIHMTYELAKFYPKQ